MVLFVAHPRALTAAVVAANCALALGMRGTRWYSAVLRYSLGPLASIGGCHVTHPSKCSGYK
jgi:hypothetical protein